MDQEIVALIEAASIEKIENWHGWELHFGTWSGVSVIITRSGVGKVFAAMIMQHLVDTYSVDRVIFSGVAGAIATDLEPGDLVISEDLVHHDMDVTGLGFAPGRIPFTDYHFFTADQTMLERASEVLLEKGKLRKGRIGTGDQFITEKGKLPELGLDAVDMEGCAVAQVCTVQKTPFLIIRIISDRADGSADKDFLTNLPLYAARSIKVIDALI